MLIEAMFNYIQQHACKMAYVGLMATPGTEEFYEKFGFMNLGLSQSTLANETWYDMVLYFE